MEDNKPQEPSQELQEPQEPQNQQPQPQASSSQASEPTAAASKKPAGVNALESDSGRKHWQPPKPVKKKTNPIIRLFYICLLALIAVMAWLSWQWWMDRQGMERNPLAEKIWREISEATGYEVDDGSAPVQSLTQNSVEPDIETAESVEMAPVTTADMVVVSEVKAKRDVLGEATMLLNLADQRYWLGAQLADVVPMLQQAKSVLMQVDNPAWLAITQQIENDIAMLEGLPGYQISETWQQLMALDKTVTEIPYLASREFAAEPVTNTAVNESGELDVWQKVADKLQSLVRVRYHDEFVQPLMDETAHQQFKLLVLADLAQARAALQARDVLVYQGALDLADRHAQMMTASAPDAVARVQKRIAQLKEALREYKRPPLQSVIFVRELKSQAEAAK